MADNLKVYTKHHSYEELEDQWMKCRDCAEGSAAVKARGTKYLPALDSQKKEATNTLVGVSSKYQEYLLRTLFYNAMGRTIQGLSGAIFQKAPAVSAKTADQDLKDITLTGETFEMFALYVTKEYLTTGRSGILVDMSDEESTKERPYWVCYKAEEIINWRFEKMGGDQELCLVVLMEHVEEIDPEDEFVSKQIIQYRVLRLVEGVYSQQVYKAVKGDDNKTQYIPEDVIIPTRRGIPLNFIPFSLPWDMKAPPLIDLVEVNLSHYRGTAQLKHGLHFVALPTPWVSGQVGDSSKPLPIGAGVAWSLDVNGKAGMLEFTGQGLGAISKDLEHMEHMMATLGARLLEQASRYAETALSVAVRHSSEYATLRTIAQVVEAQLTFALKIHTWWTDSTIKLVIDSKADVQLNKVFFDQSVTADELRALVLALQAGSISYDTFYSRLATTGWTREGVDAALELEAIKKDGDQFKPPAKPGLQQPDPISSKPGSPNYLKSGIQ